MAYQKFNNGRMAAIVTSDTDGDYIPPPGVTNTAAAGTSATWTLTSTAITAISLNATYKGSGYATPPTITVTGGSGTGAIITANLAADGSIGSLTIVNGGSGYTGATPTVTVSGGTFNYAQPCQLYVASVGNVKFLTAGGDVITLNSVPAFTLLPINVIKVYTSDTTSGIKIFGVW